MNEFTESVYNKMCTMESEYLRSRAKTSILSDMVETISISEGVAEANRTNSDYRVCTCVDFPLSILNDVADSGISWELDIDQYTVIIKFAVKGTDYKIEERNRDVAVKLALESKELSGLAIANSSDITLIYEPKNK